MAEYVTLLYSEARILEYRESAPEVPLSDAGVAPVLPVTQVCLASDQAGVTV